MSQLASPESRNQHYSRYRSLRQNMEQKAECFSRSLGNYSLGLLKEQENWPKTVHVVLKSKDDHNIFFYF